MSGTCQTRIPGPKAALAAMVLAAAAVLLTPPATAAEKPAKRLFGAKKMPAVLNAAAHGFYSKGCLAGGIQIAADGPNWQAMRLSRNRRWGHPELVELVARLSVDAKKKGWNGLMVGDLAQPRGGPMLTGHASHQIGLDADIWLMQMPNRRLSRREREKLSAISMLKNRYHVDDRKWTKTHTALLKTAASYRNVERVLVHPGIKKKLCDTVKGDRSWLRKVRPYWGHHYHFHLRIGCPRGSTGCRKQAVTPRGDGCGEPLDWWFKVGLRPPRKLKPGEKRKPAKKKRALRMTDLPRACRTVLGAGSPNSLAAVTYTGDQAAGKVAAKALAAAASAKPVTEAIGKLIGETDKQDAGVPIPKPRPSQ